MLRSLALWLCASTLLGAASGCAPQRLRAGEPRQSGSALTVATFNLHFPAVGDHETLEVIGRTDADVVFLQEVTPRWQAVLEERYGALYPHRAFAPAGRASGLGVLSRHPLQNARVLPAPVNHPAAIVQVETPLGGFQVLNVHLRSVFTPAGKSFIRGCLTVGADHVRELAHFFPELGAMPTLVVGDFNENPGGAGLEWLEERGFSNAVPRYWHAQYTYRTLAGQLRLAFDHILFDTAFEPLDAWVLRQGNSDHFPVVARLRLASR